MEELAGLLGTTKEKLRRLSDEMGEFTGKKNLPTSFLEKICSERTEALAELGLSEKPFRKEILEALRDRAEKVEEELMGIFKQPDPQDHTAIEALFARAYGIANPGKRLFLKEGKAKEFLRKNPPQNILDQLGYDSVDELLEKEDLFEVYSGLRFLEDRKWQNEVFFAPLAKLTPEDFEKRDITMRILDPRKWGSSALNFAKKKFHNTTHLKELGVVIIIPIEYIDGALTRMFSMMLHYLNEVSFYARYFETLVGDKESFAEKFISALKGDIRETPLILNNIITWVIMQRYLAKEDPNDPRLLVSHISPEALHWSKAVANLTKLGADAPGLSFWAGKAHLAGFFEDKLTSFNFEDNVFSLAAGPDAPQYTYHVCEALWNRFFTEWFDREDVLETLMIEDFGQGFVGFKIRNLS